VPLKLRPYGAIQMSILLLLLHDPDLQQYLRLHARTDDFTTTVAKARKYVEAQNLAKITKKPALRMAASFEPDHSDQIKPILDGLQQVLQTVLEGQNHQAEARNSREKASNKNGSKKGQNNQAVSPATSDSSVASQNSNRKVQFRNQTSGRGD